jgi:hypothetical protein
MAAGEKSKTPLKKACDEHPHSPRHLEVTAASDYPPFSPHHRITGTKNSIRGRSRVAIDGKSTF